MLDSDTLKPIAFLCAKALQESVLKLNSSDTVYLTLTRKLKITKYWSEAVLGLLTKH